MGIHSDLILSQADPRPMYLQIFEQIRARIAAGDWPPGQEIPSIRQLAVALSISVITVKRAYLELERAGLIATQQGKGSTVAAGAAGLAAGGEAPPVSAPLAAPPSAPQSPELPPPAAARLDLCLAEAARLGALLGLSPGELAERLRRAAAAFPAEHRHSDPRELP